MRRLISFKHLAFLLPIRSYSAAASTTALGDWLARNESTVISYRPDPDWIERRDP